MPTINELDAVYMGTAMLHAKLSKAKRSMVGACMVTRTGIIIPGVNGLPNVLGNELELVMPDGSLVTKPTVIHAEQACMNKCAREGVSSEGAIMYITLASCLHCASNIIAGGIKEVIYMDEYRDMSGIELLSKHLTVRRYMV